MVFFWPWGRNVASPASFERILSTLSSRIAATQSQLDNARSSSRRVKVFGTLYLGFAYLVYAIVLILVIGRNNMGTYEWSGMAGGPFFIYLIRALTSTYYNLRIEALSNRLQHQQNERAKTIQKLKDATKYDSTLQLLQKYGGGSRSPKKGSKEVDEEKSHKSSQEHKPVLTRTNMLPPPTANMPRRDVHFHGLAQSQAMQRQALQSSTEFAPNAFSLGGTCGPDTRPQFPPIPSVAAAPDLHWYDRILETILGEDETASNNRIVLLCKYCRLVNGQAPPGIKSLAELGSWRCMSCGEANGEEMTEGEIIVRGVLMEQQRGRSTRPATTDEEDSSVEPVEVDGRDIDDQANDEAKESMEGSRALEQQRLRRRIGISR